MYVGLVLYDLISGKRRLGTSKMLSRAEIIKTFPSVKKEGLKGGVRYFDGAFNDARMVISLLQTAKESGCEIKNYTEVIKFLYDDEKICGVVLKDTMTNNEYEVYSDNVINTAGPFSDSVRKLDDQSVKNIIEVSSGIHIVVDKKFLPNDEGLMIPKTEDGRVLFMLPYLGKCLVGTTDENAKVQTRPPVSEDDIEYLLRHMKKYFDVEVTSEDILSSWSGLRPLAVAEDTNSTQEIVREHAITKSKSGLVSIVGGKWTTYRKMAEEVLDDTFDLANRKNLHTCSTKKYKLVGSRENQIEFKGKLDRLKLDKDLLEHLWSSYGDCAVQMLEYIDKYGTQKVHIDYPYIMAEVYYSIDREFTRKPLDFLVRRSGLGFIDKRATKECIEKVSLIHKDMLDWTEEEYVVYKEEANMILDTSL